MVLAMRTRGRKMIKAPALWLLVCSARSLGIKVRFLGSRQDHADILFYDQSRISDKMLASPDFLCAQWGKQVVTWTFKRVGSKWEAAHPFFDNETEGPCPE